MTIDDPVPSRREVHLFATGEPRRGLYRYFPPATRAELWAGLAFVVLSLLAAAWVIKCRFEALALEQDPVIVQGNVVRLWVTKENNGTHYRIEYEYPAPPEAEAPKFRNKTQLPQEYFELLKEGGPVAVRVCRTDPANHQVIGERPRPSLNTTLVLFGLGLLALLALAGTLNLWWWRVSRGTPQPAQFVVVVDVKNVS